MKMKFTPTRLMGHYWAQNSREFVDFDLLRISNNIEKK